MEQVSALMDGELNAEAADRQVARLKSDKAARELWDSYHLIGDAMRGGVPAMPGFASRFSEKLAAEPTVLAPRPLSHVPRKRQHYAMAAAASVAALAVVGWMGYGVMKAEVPPAQVAKATAPVVAQTPVVTLAPKVQVPASVPPALAAPARAEHVHEYMLAHWGISPTTQIQGVTTYIRTVSANDE